MKQIFVLNQHTYPGTSCYGYLVYTSGLFRAGDHNFHTLHNMEQWSQQPSIIRFLELPSLSLLSLEQPSLTGKHDPAFCPAPPLPRPDL
jgi:hypothetical protein